jgi:hypothetical protein
MNLRLRPIRADELERVRAGTQPDNIAEQKSPLKAGC